MNELIIVLLAVRQCAAWSSTLITHQHVTQFPRNKKKHGKTKGTCEQSWTPFRTAVFAIRWCAAGCGLQHWSVTNTWNSFPGIRKVTGKQRKPVHRVGFPFALLCLPSDGVRQHMVFNVDHSETLSERRVIKIGGNRPRGNLCAHSTQLLPVPLRFVLRWC